MIDFLIYIVFGFIAQLIDGTLGMAYGVSASALLLGYGLSPAAVSSTVHSSEIFTTGISGISHHYFNNIDRSIFWKLTIFGVIGAIVGAYILCCINGEILKPFIAFYLIIMGISIIIKSIKNNGTNRSRANKLHYLGFFGAFCDAIGGGGWGPIVTSTLVARGNNIRKTIGSVNAAEFFVTLAASITFLLTIGISNLHIIIPLAVGGIFAAPLGAYACKKIPSRFFSIIVGTLVIVLSIRTIFLSL